MLEIVENIREKISFEKKEAFSKHLNRCIEYVKGTEEGHASNFTSVIFKMDQFFKGFSPFISECGKDKKYEAGVEALSLIFEELGVEMEKSECFILFHLRGLGKFKIKESKLYEELRSLYGEYKSYALEQKELSYALRGLMKGKFINYRKGNIQINPQALIRYRIY